MIAYQGSLGTRLLLQPCVGVAVDLPYHEGQVAQESLEVQPSAVELPGKTSHQGWISFLGPLPTKTKSWRGFWRKIKKKPRQQFSCFDSFSVFFRSWTIFFKNSCWWWCRLSFFHFLASDSFSEEKHKISWNEWKWKFSIFFLSSSFFSLICLKQLFFRRRRRRRRHRVAYTVLLLELKVRSTIQSRNLSWR